MITAESLGAPELGCLRHVMAAALEIPLAQMMSGKDCMITERDAFSYKILQEVNDLGYKTKFHHHP